MTVRHTTYLRLPLPDFTQAPWHAALQGALQAIDRAIYQALIAVNSGPWANATTYSVGMVRVDADLGTQWMTRVTHTSGVAPQTFAQYRAAFPTHWIEFATSLNARGVWANDTAYGVYDWAYDPNQFIIAYCSTAHVSSAAPATILTDAANWVTIADFPSANTAFAITYSGATSALVAANVQDAIDELVTNYKTADTALTAALALKAPLASPVLTGLPTTPTAAYGTGGTGIASQAYADAAAWQTGDVKLSLQPTAQTGWRVCDDGTIGDVSSGATLASATAQALFTLLFDNVSDTAAPILTSVGGATTRAAQINAATAWAAHCRMSLTKMLGRALAIAGAGSGLTSRALGETVGAESVTLGQTNLPNVNFSSASLTASTVVTNQAGGVMCSVAANGIDVGSAYNFAFQSLTASTTMGGNVPSGGSGTPFSVMQPSSFLKVHIKL